MSSNKLIATEKDKLPTNTAKKQPKPKIINHVKGVQLFTLEHLHFYLE